MKYQYFLDESGNTGDLVKLPADLSFADQPFFALSCVGVDDCEDLDVYISGLKKRHRIQGEELKAKNLYKNNPDFILDLFDYIVEKKSPFYVEVVEKKYCAAVSIVNHQIIPPYFQLFETERQTQGLRNELADYLSENLPVECYNKFFEACVKKSEESVKASIKSLREYIRSSGFKFKYNAEVAKCLRATLELFHSEIKTNPNIVNNLVPIPDINKKEREINLLPHVHSWYNIIGKVNKKHNADLNEVVFYHDKQDHFDEILLFCSEQIKMSSISNPFDPTTNFNVICDINLQFPDSKKSSGVQLADVLAGFFSRYVMDFLYSENTIDDIYHDIFSKLISAYGPNNNYGINFVLPIQRRDVLFKKFNL